MVVATDKDTGGYVDVTQLWLADGACEEVAERCDRLREELTERIERLRAFAPVSHEMFGDCEEGRGWSRLVRRQADASAGSLAWVLRRHQSTLDDFADTIRAIGVAYRVMDQCGAVRIDRAR